MTSSLVGSEMCIRDRKRGTQGKSRAFPGPGSSSNMRRAREAKPSPDARRCLLYTSDAADDM
eukprot:3056633-Prorocentrum_lima.AAC.1